MIPLKKRKQIMKFRIIEVYNQGLQLAKFTGLTLNKGELITVYLPETEVEDGIIHVVNNELPKTLSPVGKIHSKYVHLERDSSTGFWKIYSNAFMNRLMYFCTLEFLPDF